MIKMRFTYSATAIAIAAALTATPAYSQETPNVDEKTIEKIQVTATRRAGTLQEVPINISALSSDVIAQQNIEDLDDIARWVPGLTVTDQGGRNDSPIVVRGLNTNSSGPGADGGTVATYFGEIPLFLNLRLVDVERVEVLIGPQGTLYGAGTLGGAIRYIPKEAEMDITSGQVWGDVFSMSESDSSGGEAGFVFNTPLIDDTLALRASLNYFNSPGFLDYGYVVREPGVSLPDPDASDQNALDSNLRRVEDANGEETLTGRVALRWTPTDDVDATLTYFFQNLDVEGRSITHFESLSTENGLRDLIGPYESAYRYEEPRELDDELLSLEIKADLGFAELVSATGLSKFEADGQRDQTDLLIRLAYSYEEFPAFSSFTRELDETTNFTQELRLVSASDGDLDWIVGAFYNKQESEGESREFTPNYDVYLINDVGIDGNFRPDSLEYLSADETEVEEMAIFGEVGYQVNDKLSVTLGLRAYQYDVVSDSGVTFPLFDSVFGGEPSDVINLELVRSEADDSGTLFKFNTSYQITDTALAFLTISEGFRIGGSNGVPACTPEQLADGTQDVCALPNEVLFTPDTTTNYELGFKSTFLKNKLHFNASVFRVDWSDAQVAGATENGQQPITSNAASAQSSGLELYTRAILTDDLTVYATYAYTKAELTDDALFLFGVVDPDRTVPGLQDFFDGKDGDRLPGSPENQFSLGMTYTQEVFDSMLLDVNYGFTWQSDVYSKVGLRADGEEIPGFAVSNFSARLSDEDWSLTFYVDNLFDKYAFTSVRRDVSDIGLSQFPQTNQNRTDLLRNYGHYVLTPRVIGLRFDYNFEL